MKYFLAIDLGASSSRHILGWLQDGALRTETVHSFKNEIIDIDGTMCRDIDHIFAEVVTGIKKCADIGKIPETIAINGIGADFVLLDAKNARIGHAVSCRDSRTGGMERFAFETMSEAEMYRRTGIFSHNINTIYQLLNLQKQNPDLLGRAHSLMMIPDYLNFMLTGVKMSEYTNATTTGLLNSGTKDWDDEIIQAFGLPRRIFGDVCNPGDVVGELSAEVAEEVGFSAKVVLCASHDTASAVVATPFDAVKKDSSLFLYSGTSSFLGAEIAEAYIHGAGRLRGFSNEGGYSGGTRFLKSVMGMCMLQSVTKEFGGKYSLAELDALAQTADIESVVDCGNSKFVAPSSMRVEILLSCLENGQEVPFEVSEFARVVYKSLAAYYHRTIVEMEEIFDKTFSHLHIIGKGSQSKFLNSLTAEATGKKIIAGPVEAAAIGNIAVQMIAAGVFGSLDEARDCIRRSGL